MNLQVTFILKYIKTANSFIIFTVSSKDYGMAQMAVILNIAFIVKIAGYSSETIEKFFIAVFAAQTAMASGTLVHLS